MYVLIAVDKISKLTFNGKIKYRATAQRAIYIIDTKIRMKCQGSYALVKEAKKAKRKERMTIDDFF